MAPHSEASLRAPGAGTFDPGGEWVVVAGASRRAAKEYAERVGLAGAKVVDRHGLSALGDRLSSESDPPAVCLHTLDWRRQPLPQLYVTTLLRAGVRKVVVADEAGGVRSWTRMDLAREALKLPSQVLSGVGSATAEVARLARAHRRALVPPRYLPAEPSAVLVIWIGNPESLVGGSVTHISGVLSGFKNRGLTTGLVSAVPPPPQLAGAVDVFERLPPATAGERSLRQLEAICANGPVRDVAQRLARQIDADFVYQRHERFVVAGLDTAANLGIPFVLEWNVSAAWVLENWSRLPIALRRALTRLVSPMERHAAGRASLVAAVSEAAREMAIAAGVSPDRTATLPNAVDIRALDRDIGVVSSGAVEPGTVGWVGSFGPWHGADVLVRSIAEAGPSLRAVLVGDGPERAGCEALARDLGVLDRITLTGALPHAEALRLLARCEVLASPQVPVGTSTDFFGSPTKVFEFMALGRPIVASRIGQVGEVLEDGRTAVLVPPGDPAALAAGISRVLRSTDRGAGLAAAAREEVEARHTWDRRAVEILDLISADG